MKELDDQLSLFFNKASKLSVNEQMRVEGWEIDSGHLLIKESIARGTFGNVYTGVYRNKDVAVKLLDCGEGSMDAVRKAFKQEVTVWYNLNHMNITKFIGATMDISKVEFKNKKDKICGTRSKQYCCIVVEYLSGGTLKSYLFKNREKKLPLNIVLRLALDLARGLSYLHSKNIVHRDVKTENMLLDKNHTLKITDFGVARLEALNPNEMTGTTGTLGYMAPEVINGKPYNRKCDVYGFGICLWEIYCCNIAYDPSMSFSELTLAIVQQKLRPHIPKCCPSSLAQVMKRCWDADPNKRPEMEEVVKMLEAVDTSKGSSSGNHHLPHGCFCFASRILF